MKNKTIVFFVLNIFQTGGIERVVSEISNELCKNFNITILSLFKTADMPKFKLDDKIKVINILGEPVDLRKKFFYAKRQIKEKLKEIDCDFFVNCGMGYVPLNIFARKRFKYISWEHSNCNIGNKFGLTWWGRYLSNKYADRIVFLTKKDLNNFSKKFNHGILKDKYVQIYNPITFTRKSEEYDSESKKIISCGRLSYQKGFDLLIDVAQKVFSSPVSNGWSWDIYGSGELEAELTKKISEQGLEGKVLLKGNVDNIIDLYQNYSFFVLTSRYEGFCMVNIEASENLLPIVSFNCDCGPDEIIMNNVNGFVIDDFNIEEMAKRILELIENKDMRKLFSQNTTIDKEKLRLSSIITMWNELLNGMEQ